jgi:hypothetical protein
MSATIDYGVGVVARQTYTLNRIDEEYFPDPLDDTGETFPGGEISGNVCISVVADQLEGATIRVEELMSFDDTRAFYALN